MNATLDKQPSPIGDFIPLILVLLFCILMFVFSSCSQHEQVMPKQSFPVIIQKDDLIFHLWRSRTVDVYYTNFWDGHTSLLDRWCVDTSGYEHCVVGVGTICVSGECVELE